MVYNSLVNFHQKLIGLFYMHKEIPKRLLTSFYQEELHVYVDLETPIKSKICCFQ